MGLKYGDKAARFKEIAYRQNRGDRVKWRNPDELQAYLEGFGGGLKVDKRRRRGYLVCVLQHLIVAEVPMDFAEKVLAMGGFP